MIDELVTVILRVHEEYFPFLPRALASLSTQTFKNFLVFIVNDGPLPAEEELGKWLPPPEETGLRGHLVATEERSGYYAVPCNQVIPHVMTPWIAFMDADNEFAPEHLEALVTAVRSGPARPAFAYVRRKYVIDPSFEGNPPALGDSPYVPWTRENVQKLLMGPTHNFIDSGDLLIGRGTCYWLAHRFGFIFDPEMRRFGDWDLARRLAILGAPGAAVDVVTNIYHWHGQNIQLTRQPGVVALPEELADDILARFEKGTGHEPS